jgi:hypothetical protein
MLAETQSTGKPYAIDYHFNIDGNSIVPDAQMQAPLPMMYDMADGGVGYQASSLRFKENVANLDFDTDTFLSLDARTFDWKDSGRNDIGFIAEEVAAFDERLAVADGQGGYISMHYDKMTVYLFKVVKDLHAKVADLEAKINTLENK